MRIRMFASFAAVRRFALYFMKLAAIVPAYNEEKTVGNIARVLVDSGVFSEVMVISDGSTDATAERAREAGATVHELPINRGKGGAMRHAVTHTDADILFFADADLYGFEKKHIEAVVNPVAKGECAMAVGVRDRGPFWTAVSKHLPLIGGERAMLRSIFEHIPDKYLRGFMVEIATNEHCARHNLKICKVVMPGVTIRRKIAKVGWIKGIGQYIKMFWQVGKAMIVVRMGKGF